MANWKPTGCHSVIPALTVRGGTQALDFYKKAFGAEEISRMAGPNGKLMHGEIRIGDSLIMLSDEFPQGGCRSPQSLGGTTVNLYVYFEDVDKAYDRAVKAGATGTMPPSDMFWGDRWGIVTDPFGHSWGLATHKEDVPADEMARRGAEFAKQMSSQTKSVSGD